MLQTMKSRRHVGWFVSFFVLAACGDKNKPVALLPDATVATPPADAGPVDIGKCAGCQLAPIPAWTFEGIYRDDACTDPLAQLATPACASVPALGATTITYVDEVGVRKGGESAAVTLAEQIAPTAARFRKTAKGCVRANEAAVDLTPASCSGQRVCSDESGALTCGTCRTLANGCPDFEPSRIYAAIDDPALKKAKPSGGGGASLALCCKAIADEAKRQGNAPELTAAAAQCTALAQTAANGNAPELGVLRTMLAGRKLPGCTGF